VEDDNDEDEFVAAVLIPPALLLLLFVGVLVDDFKDSGEEAADIDNSAKGASNEVLIKGEGEVVVGEGGV
jgi:hypothetical protein